MSSSSVGVSQPSPECFQSCTGVKRKNFSTKNLPHASVVSKSVSADRVSSSTHSPTVDRASAVPTLSPTVSSSDDENVSMTNNPPKRARSFPTTTISEQSTVPPTSGETTQDESHRQWYTSSLAHADKFALSFSSQRVRVTGSINGQVIENITLDTATDLSLIHI